MKIKAINIYGYGKLQDVQIPVDDLQTFYGKNEAGKTTVMSFIRHILYGFPTKAHAELSYEPKNASQYGGNVELEIDGEIVKIERVGTSAVGEVTVYYPDGRIGSEQDVKELLLGMNKDVYTGVFSFNLDDLGKISSLSKEDMGNYLLSASMTGTDAIYQVEKKLQKEQDNLYKPGGKRPLLNEQLTELKDTYTTYWQWQGKLASYDNLAKEKKTLQQDLVSVQKEKEMLEGQRKVYYQKETLRPLLQERKKHEAVAKEYEGNKDFPLQGLEQLDQLVTQIQGVDVELSRFSGKPSFRNLKIDHFTKEASREYDQQFHVLQARKEQLDTQFAVSRDELESSEAAVQVLRKSNTISRSGQSQTNTLKKLFPYFLIPSLVTLVIGLITSNLLAIITSLILASSLFFFYFITSSQRSNEPTEAERNFSATWELAEAKFQQASVAYEKILGQFEEWERESHILTEKGKQLARTVGLPGNIPLGQLTYAIDKAEQAQMEGKQQAQIEARKQALQEAYEKLLAQGNATDEESFRTKGAEKKLYDEAKKQVVILNGQLASMSQEAFWEQVEIEVDYQVLGQQVEVDLQHTREKESHLQNRLAQVTAEMKQMEEVSTYQDILYARMLQVGKTKELAKKWASVVYAKDLIAKTKEIYQRERLPQTLARAEEYFHHLTNGAYTHLFAYDNEPIQVERADGQRLKGEELSRGTAEQLYLAIRLALASTYQTAYPLVLDDPFVNFDRPRLARAMELLEKISKERQILFFTCQEHILDLQTAWEKYVL